MPEDDFNNGTSIQDVVKGAGKLTPGGAVVGSLKRYKR